MLRHVREKKFVHDYIYVPYQNIYRLPISNCCIYRQMNYHPSLTDNTPISHDLQRIEILETEKPITQSIPSTRTIVLEEWKNRDAEKYSQECLEPTTRYLQLITNGDEKYSKTTAVCVAQGPYVLDGDVQQNRPPSGEHVVRPLPIDARRLRRRPEDDVEGVHDAGGVAQYRQHEGDEELRLQKQQQNWNLEVN
jgi:hypothetical protein